MATGRIDVLTVMAAPAGFRNGGRWRTGDVANWCRRRGQRVTTAAVLTALRREERGGNVECLGPAKSDGQWHGNNITRNAELVWRLVDAYAIKHGNEACRAAHGVQWGAK